MQDNLEYRYERWTPQNTPLPSAHEEVLGIVEVDPAGIRPVATAPRSAAALIAAVEQSSIANSRLRLSFQQQVE